jgi:hypothetical protein
MHRLLELDADGKPVESGHSSSTHS